MTEKANYSMKLTDEDRKMINEIRNETGDLKIVHVIKRALKELHKKIVGDGK